MRMSLRYVACCWLLVGGSHLTVTTHSAVAQVDTDGDGLLDVMDVEQFDLDINLAGVQLRFPELGIADLDGLSQFAAMSNGASITASDITHLDLRENQIASIERGDFEGLEDLRFLRLIENQIMNIESGAFEGLTGLSQLLLFNNEIRELNFSGATFESLLPCLAFGGLCLDSETITSLILDDATLGVTRHAGPVFDSFSVILTETPFITDASLVGLTFSDANPTDLSALLSIKSLDNVWVDQQLMDLYADEFNTFDAVEGNTVTIIEVGDCNKDGSFTAEDLACVYNIKLRDIVLSELNTLPGDLDGDGEVAFTDFLVLSENYGKASSGYVDGNIDLQGGVNFADFLILSNNFGSQPAAVVPEPDCLRWVLFMASLGLAARKRPTRSAPNARS